MYVYLSHPPSLSLSLYRILSPLSSLPLHLLFCDWLPVSSPWCQKGGPSLHFHGLWRARESARGVGGERERGKRRERERERERGRERGNERERGGMRERERERGRER